MLIGKLSYRPVPFTNPIRTVALFSSRTLRSVNAVGTAEIQSVPMLSQALKANEASSAKPEPKKPAFLSKHPAPRTNGNIMQAFNPREQRDSKTKQFQTPPQFLSSSIASSPSPSMPVQTASHGSRRKPVSNFEASRSRGPESNSFAALFRQQSDSFQNPSNIDSSQDNELPLGLPAGVVIEDGDLSSDENFDFTLPGLRKPGEASNQGSATATTAAPQTQEIPWSTSPPSHWQPTSKPLPRTLKREMPADLQSSSPVPVAKRRTTPAEWADDEGGATQASKSLSKDPWNPTLSAVKNQKRQHKHQTLKRNADNAPGKAISVAASNISEPVNLFKPIKSKSKTPKNAAFALSKEQQHVLDLVVNKGQSVFFTGPAGTGKSVLMRSIIQELKKKWARDPERLGVTASTGLAACNIGGMTLHSFSGIGLGKEDAPTLVKKIRRNIRAKTRWVRARTIIIDEISMVDGELFDKLSQIGRTIRNNGRPWGGIQLVITGDFFQLPPVPEGFENKKREVKFAFEADTWTTSIDHTIGLTEVFRQKDPAFAEMLNEMRLGRISAQTVQAFKKLARPLTFDDGVEMTELFPTRTEVDSSNQKRLDALPGATHPFEATDTGVVDPLFREKLLANMMVPKHLDLKTGAQVMLIKNIDDTLVNGTIGKILDFRTEDEFESMNKKGEDSGGEAERDWGTDSKFKKRMSAFRNEMASGPSTKGIKYPVVRFHTFDGNTRDVFVLPEDWKVELPNGDVQASRKQIPLILAWALSIHKAQGQTLDRVRVNLGKVFEKGQAYVALSRATTQYGLQVLGFEEHKVMAHPKVVRFYNLLYSAQQAVSKKGTLKDFINRAQAYPAVPQASKSRSTGFKEVRVLYELDELDEEKENVMAAHG